MDLVFKSPMPTLPFTRGTQPSLRALSPKQSRHPLLKHAPCFPSSCYSPCSQVGVPSLIPARRMQTPSRGLPGFPPDRISLPLSTQRCSCDAHLLILLDCGQALSISLLSVSFYSLHAAHKSLLDHVHNADFSVCSPGFASFWTPRY